MKTKEELIQLKQEYESLNSKLKELTEDELIEVIGGADSYTHVTVPNVIGLIFEDAKTVLSNVNLSYDIKYENDSSKENNIVLQSDPLPGIIVPINTKVMLTLSIRR